MIYFYWYLGTGLIFLIFTYIESRLNKDAQKNRELYALIKPRTETFGQKIINNVLVPAIAASGAILLWPGVVIWVIKDRLSNYKFKIAGTKFVTTDEDALKGLEILEKLDNVEFVGHISNELIPDFLSKSYCLLNTSRLEGFSNTFLEAWAVGVPVITTKNVNPDNVISKYHLGLVCDNYSDIPSKMEEMIEKKMYLDYNDRCVDYIREYHDPTKLAEIFLQDMINSSN